MNTSGTARYWNRACSQRGLSALIRFAQWRLPPIPRAASRHRSAPPDSWTRPTYARHRKLAPQTETHPACRRSRQARYTEASSPHRVRIEAFHRQSTSLPLSKHPPSDLNYQGSLWVPSCERNFICIVQSRWINRTPSAFYRESNRYIG